MARRARNRIRRPARARRWSQLALLGAFLLSACGEVDVTQVRICEALIPALYERAIAHDVLRREADATTRQGVIVHYRITGPPEARGDHWVACRFAGRDFSYGRANLLAVVTDREGRLSEVRLFMLKRFWLGVYRAQPGTEPGPGRPQGPPAWLYFLQQAVNALIVCCVYGLLAAAYTVVYALIGRINLAFGELAMIAGYVSVLGVVVLSVSSGLALLPTLALVLVLAVVVTGTYGWATQRLVFAPLRDSATQAPLIATIGLAIALQEFVRLTQGTRERWLQPVLSEPHLLASAEGFAVVLTSKQIVIVILALALYAAILRLFSRGPFGRAWRACAQDVSMAALCGIRVERTLGATFALSGALAAVSGYIVTLHYGTVGFTMGTMLGFKALVAAVVGGIGSVPGALLGGALIGILETFWSGYLSIADRDLAVFGLLAVALLFRPQGLLGGPAARRA
jgi:branched-chain amino acid transport system permease protein